MADLDEQARIKEIERADRAKAVLDNPLYQAAFDDLEAHLMSQLENTHDEVAVLKLHKMFVCNRKVRNILREHIETGKLAVNQLEAKRKFKLWSSN